LRGKKIASGSWKLAAGGRGVQEHAEIEWDSGGRAENLEKRAWSKKMREKSKPPPFAKGAKGCRARESHRVKAAPPACSHGF